MPFAMMARQWVSGNDLKHCGAFCRVGLLLMIGTALADQPGSMHAAGLAYMSILHATPLPCNVFLAAAGVSPEAYPHMHAHRLDAHRLNCSTY